MAKAERLIECSCCKMLKALGEFSKTEVGECEDKYRACRDCKQQKNRARKQGRNTGLIVSGLNVMASKTRWKCARRATW